MSGWRRPLAAAGALAWGAFLLLAAAGAAQGAERLDLRIRLREGVSYDRRITYTQTLSLGGVQEGQVIKRTLAMGLSFRLKGYDANGNAVISATYRSLYFIQQDLAGTVVYDSERPTPTVPSVIRDLAPLIGRSAAVIVSPEGRLLRLEGAGRESVEAIMSLYPDAPVAVGERWTRNRLLSPQVPITLESVFTLRERKGGTAFIDIRADVRQKPGSGPLDFGTVLLGYDVTGKAAGTVAIEEDSGWPREGKLAYSFAGQMELGGNARLPIRVRAPFTGQGTVELAPM